MNDLNDSAQGSVSRHDQTFLQHPRLARSKPKAKATASNAPLAIAPTKGIPLATNGSAEVFQSHRPRLFGIAYRMLGSRAEAEDLVQEAYLRWHQSATDEIQSPIAFLVTITTRLCLDRLRELKQERERYVGPWLPEPFVEDQFPSPEMQLELTGEVSVAFLTVLERLGPEERAGFLLHDVFDYDYPEVAQVLGKTEANCRQMIHRARIRVRESRPRFSVTPESRERALAKFLSAIGTGDRTAVMALLTDDAEYMADGGGKVIAALRVLRGPERLGWLYHCVARRFPGVSYRLIRVNGELGAAAVMDGQLFSIVAFVINGERVSRIYNVRNPDKLSGIALPALGG
jgi:RNA polymerase sigma-70 factor, ECF subfamily